MKDFKVDFYDSTNLKSYNLNDSMKYQLAILDSLDNVTREHSENVASLACRICEYMNMQDMFTVYCTVCAYLHDIGKQFIPPVILQKPSDLTDEEYEIIKTHTTLGAKICMKDKKLSAYVAGPLYHHEALDGTGYPNHAAEKDIPIEAQIIRVADEFDAITHKRQYKSHINVCTTLKILIEEAKPSNGHKVGKVNPKAVKALIKVVTDDTEYELYNLGLYIDYLEEEIKRLEEILGYQTKMEDAVTAADKEYYYNGIIQLLAKGETFDNIRAVLSEYKKAYVRRSEEFEALKKELKIIKKLVVK